ncbi:hypothetical protein [Leclercia sp.]|uniref:hypothetical protein n=1 Tax=Leclercia sp. TaxID=1898428 RepID=UPI0028BDA4A7|nr:hypothetical protein [Leclercia sp.]
MSKRFGRNQRRRAREELAAATADSNWHQSRASHLQNELYATETRLGEIQRQLNVAKACLGDKHPAFPAGKFDAGFKPHPEDPFMMNPYRGQTDQATVMRFATPRRDDHKRAVHYVLYAGKERVAYAISDHALQNVPRDVLAFSMTQELVELLLDNMSKEPRS